MSELLNRQLALRWLKYANNDLHAATIMLSRDDVAPRTACFLAQQSAEKTLKSVLIFKGLDVLKTHDLDAISEKLPEIDYLRFESLDLSWLTEWSVSSRYPGDWPEALYVVKISREMKRPEQTPFACRRSLRKGSLAPVGVVNRPLQSQQPVQSPTACR